MMKVAFKMQLKPGCKEEYRKRHDAIWPELQELLRHSGVSDYSIFLDEATHILFAVQRQSGEQSSQHLGTNPIVQRWWAYMADLMDTHPDHSPVATPLELMFHMD